MFVNDHNDHIDCSAKKENMERMKDKATKNKYLRSTCLYTGL